MSPEIKLEWLAVSWDQVSRHSKRGRYLWVSDGAHSHATVLPSSVSIRDALANYEAGHVTAGEEAGSHITDVAEWSDNGLTGRLTIRFCGVLGVVSTNHRPCSCPAN